MKTKHLLAILLSTLGILEVTGISEAKCALKQYTLESTVIDAKTGATIKGARVIAFFDDYSLTWSKGYLTTYPDFFETDARGHFTATFYFDSLRRMALFGGEICDLRPSKIELIITAPRFLSKRAIFGIGSLKKGSHFAVPKIALKASMTD